MRISIWQQFASNHSGHFWVMGSFKSIEDARIAYDELRNILFDIDRWHREHKEESRAAHLAGDILPLPPEQMIALKYEVEWPQTIDWTNFAQYWIDNNPAYSSVRSTQIRSQELIDEAIAITGRVVTVTNPDQTWMTVQPFQSLLQKLGVQTIGYDMEMVESGIESFELHPIVRFSTPDTTIADRIETEFQAYLSNKMMLNVEAILPPWHDDQENFRKMDKQNSLLREEDIEIIKNNWQREYELTMRLGTTPAGLSMGPNRLELRDTGLTIRRSNLDFTLIDIWFHNQELGIAALIAYLEVNGCTNIDFNYSNEPILDEE